VVLASARIGAVVDDAVGVLIIPKNPGAVGIAV
jgi:hypothetical protein